MTPSRSRSRSPDQDKVEHADILGHYNQLAHAGLNLLCMHMYSVICFLPASCKSATLLCMLSCKLARRSHLWQPWGPTARYSAKEKGTRACCNCLC